MTDKSTEVAPQSDRLLSIIERMLGMPDLPIEQLEKMLGMYERALADQRRSAHAAAKAAAMAEMPPIPKRGIGHNKMPYAKLSDTVSTTRPVLARHGLSLTFSTEINGSTITVTAHLTHSEGYCESVPLPLPFDASGAKNPVQAIGSSQTYGQRYTAQSILGLSLADDVDDDGLSAIKSDRITAEQYMKLRDKIEEAGASQERLCAHFKIASLEELPRVRLGHADAMLDAKMAAKEAPNG